jgi:hypothetical protein
LVVTKVPVYVPFLVHIGKPSQPIGFFVPSAACSRATAAFSICAKNRPRSGR